MRTSWITIDGMRIALHESSGSAGPTVVMLHGHWSAALAFRNQLEGAIGREFRLVAVDLPGEGESDTPGARMDVYSMPGLADVLAKIARATGFEDGVFVGWSLGGHVLIEAMPALSRARGFCIFGTPPLRFPPNFEEAYLPHPVLEYLFKENLTDVEFVAWRGALTGEPVSIPPGLPAAMRRTDARKRPALLASVGSVGYRDQVEVVANLRQPLAVLHGERDAVTPLPYLQRLPMPSLWRGAVQVLPRAGHAMHWDSADLFNGLLSAFVRET